MNIFGTGGNTDEKTQNQTATPGFTDFAGVLAENGVPVATTAFVGSYLPLAGGTMSGDIAMGTHNLLNAGTISGAANSRTADNIVSNAGASVNNRVAVYSGTSGKVITDSGATLSQYLPLAGGTMTGEINAGNQYFRDVYGIYIDGNLTVPANPPANGLVIVTNFDTLYTFNSVGGIKQIMYDSDLAMYLALAGGTMTGTINMGAQEISNVSAIRSNNTNIVYGTGASASSTNSVAIGNGASTSATSSIAIGSGATANDASSTVMGRSSIVAGVQSTVVGASCNVTTGPCCVFGFSNISTAIGADVFGRSLTNGTASSLLMNAYANIRVAANNVTDLGTSAIKFKDIYLAGSVTGPTNTRTADNIVSCAGTSVNNRVAVFSGVTGKIITDSGSTLSQFLPIAGGTMSGSLFTPTAYGSWYSTTAYLPAFVAATPRLIPPTVATAGNLNLFTHAAGVLTYTGTPTRIFRISYNISFTSGANGTNMTFFNSYNASVVIAGGIARAFRQVTASNNATGLYVSFSDNLALGTGDTVQLGGMCALLSVAVSFNFVSCSVTGLLN